MTRAFAGWDQPKKVSKGYLYHWWLVDGSADIPFSDPNLLSVAEQKARFKKLLKESPVHSHSRAINYYNKIEPEDVLRRRMINADPLLNNDPEFWDKSYGQLLYEDEYGSD
jgi:hypothetical protein